MKRIMTTCAVLFAGCCIGCSTTTQVDADASAAKACSTEASVCSTEKACDSEKSCSTEKACDSEKSCSGDEHGMEG